MFGRIFVVGEDFVVCTGFSVRGFRWDEPLVEIMSGGNGTVIPVENVREPLIGETASCSGYNVVSFEQVKV